MQFEKNQGHGTTPRGSNFLPRLITFIVVIFIVGMVLILIKGSMESQPAEADATTSKPAVLIPDRFQRAEEMRNRAMLLKTMATVKNLGTAFEIYVTENYDSSCPGSGNIAGLRAEFMDYGYLERREDFQDAWGNDLVYECSSTPEGFNYTIKMQGANPDIIWKNGRFIRSP